MDYNTYFKAKQELNMLIEQNPELVKLQKQIDMLFSLPSSQEQKINLLFEMISKNLNMMTDYTKHLNLKLENIHDLLKSLEEGENG